MDMAGESRAPGRRAHDWFDDLLAGRAAAARLGGCTVVPLKISYVIPVPSPGRWAAITAEVDRLEAERPAERAVWQGRRRRHLRAIDGGQK